MKDKNFRILVADDEPIERMVVSKILQNHFGDEITILQAVNGREAIETVRGMGCQVVLLDISMPGIDGLEAAERIRNENPLCSIIFLTAYDEFDFAKRAIKVHALDYLLKPWSKEELIAVIGEAIHIAEQNDGNRKSLQEETSETERGEQQRKQEPQKNHAQVKFVRQYLEEHYMEDICLQDVAAALHYSDVYFCKFFKQNFDKNFIMYLSELRVEKAKELLSDIAINVRDVSRKVGYRDSGYFTKVFKRITGTTPSEYRNMQISL